jgi:hypothetical protein
VVKSDGFPRAPGRVAPDLLDSQSAGLGQHRATGDEHGRSQKPPAVQGDTGAAAQQPPQDRAGQRGGHQRGDRVEEITGGERSGQTEQTRTGWHRPPVATTRDADGRGEQGQHHCDARQQHRLVVRPQLAHRELLDRRRRRVDHRPTHRDQWSGAGPGRGREKFRDRDPEGGGDHPGHRAGKQPAHQLFGIRTVSMM